MEKQRQSILILDIIRILACLGVLAVHVAIYFDIPGKLGDVMREGSSGLNVFFVLSGFLTLVSLEHKKTLKGWYAKRLLRILPLYYAVLIIDIIAHEAIIGGTPADPNGLYWLGYFLCLNTIVPLKEIFWCNLGAISSISVFVLFYLFAPLFAKLVRNLRTAILFEIVLYAVARILLCYTEWGSAFTQFYYFGIGIIIYYAIKEQKQKIALLAGLITMAALEIIGGRGGLLLAGTVGLIILAGYELSMRDGTVKQCICGLSKASFSIYLAHGAVIGIMERCFTGNTWMKIIVLVSASLVGTIFLYYGVERSSIKMVKRRKNND